MNSQPRSYKAVIWQSEPGSVGIWVSVFAESLADAKRLLEAQHGEGTVYDLHNEEEADRPR